MAKRKKMTPEDNERQLENQRRLEEIIRRRMIIDERLRHERAARGDAETADR